MRKAAHRNRPGRIASRASFALLVGGGLALAACEDEAPAPEPPRKVLTITVQSQSVAQVQQVDGTIEAKDPVNLAFQVGGRILTRTVNIGDTVEEGEIIATLDPSDLESELAAAQASVAAAQAAVDQTAAEEVRQAQLLQDGFATQARYDEALRQLRTAQADLESAQQNANIADLKLGYTQLAVTGNGVILATEASPGDVVSAGETIVQIGSLDRRQAVFDVTGQVADVITQGMELLITLQSNPEIQVKGTLTEIAPQADSQTRTYEIKVDLPEGAPEAFRLGTVVEGTATQGVQDVFTIPATALVQTGNEPAVWLLEPTSDGLYKVKRHPVQVFRYDDDVVQISDGLKDGTAIVSAGVSALSDG